MKRRSRQPEATREPAPAVPSAGTDTARRAAPSRFQDLAVFLAIVAVAFTLRQIYVLQLSRSPLFDRPQMDELYHDQWARAIGADEPFVDGPYFRAPLYPFFLAGVYRVCGHSYLAPRILQGVLGSLSCGLLFWIGRLVFTRAVGAVAGLVAASYWVLVYFDGELLIPSLIVFLDLVLIWLLLHCARNPSGLRFGVSGAVLGLSAVARPNILLFAPAIVIWLLVRNRPQKRRALGFALCFVLGSLIPVLPVTVRNYLVGGDRVLIAWQGGTNFYIGNNPESNGMVAQVPGTPGDWWGGYHATIDRAERARGRTLKPSEVSRYYYGQAWQFIASQPTRAILLTLRKLHLFWRHWEISNNKDLYFWTERFTPLVKYLPLGFGVVGPLGILGLVCCRHRSSELFPLWGFVLVYMCSVVAFFCTARYRVPVLPPLILLGVQACFRTVRAIRQADGMRVVGAAAVLLPASLFVWIGPGAESMRDDENSFQTLADAYEKQGRLDLAIVNYHHALRSDQQPKDADIPARLGYLLALSGKFDQAEAATRDALRINPNHPQANDNLGNILSQTGRFEEAAAHFETAIQADPDYPNVHYNKGVNLLRQQRFDEAIAAFETCLNLNSDHAEAHNNLGNLLARTGRFEDAAAHFEQALRIDPASPEVHNNLANVLRSMGRLDEAVAHYRSAIRLNPDYATAHQLLGGLLVQLGRADQALSHLRDTVRLRPNDVAAALDLAWLLATYPHAEVRNGEEAVRLAEQACRLIGRDEPVALDVLAAAYAEAGDFLKARVAAQRALDSASASDRPALAEGVTSRLRLYEAGQPYRETQ